jgi:hypothetical protein
MADPEPEWIRRYYGESESPQFAPFAVDSWPLCEPWERAGVATLWDRLAIERARERAELELRLEIDRRFDRLHARVLGSSWPALEGSPAPDAWRR